MNAVMRFINNDRKDLKPWNKNMFFATTLFIVLLCIILHAALGSCWSIATDNEITDLSQIAAGFGGRKSHWHDTLYFSSLVQVFFAAFSHFNWQHVLLNMLCFAVCGVYLERKLGSLKFFALIICFAFFGGCAVAANNNSINSYGYSGVNYALYAYILVDYLFMAVPKTSRKKFDLIYGGIMLALIYFAACFKGGTTDFSFTWYPYDAFNNLGHYTSYLTGIIITVTVKLFLFFTEKNGKSPQSTPQAE